MNNLEMLVGTAYDRIKESCQKTGSYVFNTGGSIYPIYIHYALKERANMDMDVFHISITTAKWNVMLDVTWTEDGEIYALDINGEEADSLCARNIWAVLPDANIRLLENGLLYWLIETDFPEQSEQDDEYI
jgi:hypothetical protein